MELTEIQKKLLAISKPRSKEAIEKAEKRKEKHKKRMTQEKKQLLLKDLCGRLPYNCRVFYEYVDGNTTYGYSLTLNTWSIDEFNANKAVIKPYLRPLSSMTEEEKHYIDNRWGADSYGDIITYSSYEGGMSTVELADIIGFQDWLNRNHFDYRGLIPMGLALEAPKDIYKMEEQQ